MVTTDSALLVVDMCQTVGGSSVRLCLRHATGATVDSAWWVFQPTQVGNLDQERKTGGSFDMSNWNSLVRSVPRTVPLE